MTKNALLIKVFVSLLKEADIAVKGTKLDFLQGIKIHRCNHIKPSIVLNSCSLTN